MEQLENRFIVLKISDVDKYLSSASYYVLRQIVGEIQQGREQDNKTINDYIVVNLDEPYAQQVVDLVLQGGNMSLKGGKLLPPIEEFRLWRDKDIIWMKYSGWQLAVPLGDKESVRDLHKVLNMFLDETEIKRWPSDKQ